MFFIYFMLICVVNICAAKEGDICVKDGLVGLCMNILDCPNVQEDIINNQKQPQLCYNDQKDVIPFVCCVPKNIITTTTERKQYNLEKTNVNVFKNYGSPDDLKKKTLEVNDEVSTIQAPPPSPVTQKTWPDVVQNTFKKTASDAMGLLGDLVQLGKIGVHTVVEGLGIRTN